MTSDGDGSRVVAVVRDLFFVARIRETARLAGVPLVFARTPEEIAAAAPGRARPRFVLLDLTGRLRLRRHVRAVAAAPDARRCWASRPTSLARADPALARAVPAGGDQGDADPGAARAAAATGWRRDRRRVRRRARRREPGASCARLEPDATLKPEVTGALNVPNLLKVALKNEIEATEIAARWLVDHRRRGGQAGLGPPGRRRGQALPADRRAPARARRRRERARSAGQGYGPLFTYLDTLDDHRGARGGRAVHPRGDRGGEEPAVHRVLRAGGRPRDRRALPRRHRAGRALPPRARAAAAAALRRPRRKRRTAATAAAAAHARAGRGAAEEGAGRPPASTTRPGC